MTRQRSFIILGLALLSASVAGYSAVRYSSQRPTAAVETSGGTAQIVVAARDLPVGHFLTETDVQTIRWPGNAMPVGYVSQPSAVIGRGLIAGVRMNEPLLEAELAEKGSGAGMPIIIPEGMRAVSVRVDDVIAVAGYVIPSTRVDLMLTMKPISGDQVHTQVVLQNLLVLAAGQAIQKNEKGEPMPVSVVTLLVTPEQGEKLVLASAQGRIQLALRNMVDVAEVTTPGIGEARLMDVGRAPARTVSRTSAPRPRAQPSQGAVIETYKGGVRSLQRF
jgi:pilus assembly protein CpaB